MIPAQLRCSVCWLQLFLVQSSSYHCIDTVLGTITTSSGLTLLVLRISYVNSKSLGCIRWSLDQISASPTMDDL
ncbi:hypothetical protein DFH28DRAFT_968335 [Melampsora americana]|nr:hypothetical protein DFH28DRAFT_968335 [Melampsora americana]